MTACWATILTPGAEHKAHCYPNNYLSGVYYLRTHPTENTDQVVVPVKNGTLLVFPSFLQHSVDVNRSQEERISISFNVMFSSFTENLSKPLW